MSNSEIRSAYAESALVTVRNKMDAVFDDHRACLKRVDGTGLPHDHLTACRAKLTKSDLELGNTLTWRAVLEAAVCDAFDRQDIDELEECLAYVAAVSTLWIRTLKMRRRQINGC